MKIYLKIENGIRFFIPAPIWLIKAALDMSGFGIKLARKNMSEDQMSYIEAIDFKQMKEAVDVLKAYKGLKMVDIKAKDGTEVRIVI